MVPLAVVTGLLIGLSLGALGGGGSILTVPALVYLLGQTPHQATTASLLVVGLAAIIGALTHARAGRAKIKTGLMFGLLGVAGSFAGSLASAAVPANVLLAGFGVLMLVVAATMILRRRVESSSRSPGSRPAGSGEPSTSAPAGSQEPGPEVAGARSPGQARPGARRIVLVAATATGVGIITGFFGVGGGFVVVPALVLVLGFDMPAAVGTSLIVIVVDSAAALGARAGHALFAMDWTLIIAFAAAAVLGTLAGTLVAGRVSPRRLSLAFTAMIIVVALYTVAHSMPAIA